MKIKILMVAAVLLLLCGCSGDLSQEGPSLLDELITPSLYDPMHSITQQTQGAVKVYPLKRNGYTDMLFFGENLLLFRAGGTEVYKGERLTPAVTMKDLPSTVQLMHDGLGWYLEETREVIFLNDHFVEQNRIQMPEDQIGNVYIAPDGHTVYYCTQTAVRALNLDSWISRLIYEGSAAQRTILSGLFDGKMLLCEMDGKQMLLSSQTGEVLGEQSFLDTLVTQEDNFYLTAETEAGERLLFGNRKEDVCVLWPGDDSMQCVSIPQMNSAVGLCQKSDTAILSYFDLESGKKTAYIELQDVSEVRNMAADPDGKAVWIHCVESMSGDEILCRWELEKSAVEDETVYTDYYFTRENPDRKNQLILELKAEKLGENRSLKILLWDEAKMVIPNGYSYVDAYQIGETEQAVRVLEKILKNFPEDFFTKAAGRTKSGTIHILLLESISTPNPSLRSGERGLQYWLDGEMYIALQVDDRFEENLLHQIGHVIDSRVMSMCQAFDEWNRLNPQGFAYDNDLVKNLDRQDDTYLLGENRAFIDFYSMSFALEDRSTIFAYACMDGNAEYFQSAVMQNKLQTLCKGIREAFGLEGENGAYIWEQYLQNSEMT